jgi:uncharacterized protein (TIGR03382 family)
MRTLATIMLVLCAMTARAEAFCGFYVGGAGTKMFNNASTPDKDGRLETGVTHESYNNFQGRYSILHSWTGAVACADPKRGIWGGPPGGNRQIAAQPGKNLAFAPRGQIELAAMLASAPPTVGAMASTAQQPPSVIRQPRGCGGCATTGGASAGAFALLLGFVLRRRRGA